MKERRGLVRSEDILGEIRQSNFLQLGMTSSQDETILVWNAMRNYLYIVLSVTYAPNRERWLSMWDVVDTTALPEVIKSSTFEEQRSRRSLCCPAANPMHQRQRLFIECAHWWTGQKDKTQVAMTSVHSPIAGHECRVTSVFFSQDGKQILSVPRDNTARVWDPITAQPLSLPFRGHTHWAISVCLFPDGHTLLLGPAMEQ